MNEAAAMDLVPEVAALHQSARFFREADKDYVEISFVGSKDTVIHRVGPEHMARFRDEWNAYCDGVPLKVRAGTPLTDVPNMVQAVAEKYVSQNVHTAEELAALNDIQCQQLGHGTLTLRTNARTMLAMRKAKKAEEMSKRISAATASGTLSDAEAQSAMDAKYASKADVDAINGKLDVLMAVLTEKRKPGRPPKQQTEGAE